MWVPRSDVGLGLMGKAALEGSARVLPEALSSDRLVSGACCPPRNPGSGSSPCLGFPAWRRDPQCPQPDEGWASRLPEIRALRQRSWAALKTPRGLQSLRAPGQLACNEKRKLPCSAHARSAGPETFQSSGTACAGGYSPACCLLLTLLGF